MGIGAKRVEVGISSTQIVDWLHSMVGGTTHVTLCACDVRGDTKEQITGFISSMMLHGPSNM